MVPEERRPSRGYRPSSRFARRASRIVRQAGEGRPRRCAVAAAVQEDARRADTRSTVASPQVRPPSVEVPVNRSRAVDKKRRGARAARSVEIEAPEGRGVTRTGRRAGRFDARPLLDVDADSHQSSTRAREATAEATETPAD